MLLSVLDQSPIFTTPQAALKETVQLAQHCEQLGYQRYWVAEHHGSGSFAGCAPETLIAHLAVQTQSMRIGSGGIMLMHYSPYKVAELFRTLETLYPGRIDLGIGRAPGSDAWTAGALAYGSKTTHVEFFQQKVGDLQGFLNDQPPLTKPFRRVHITPNLATSVQPWMLVSSEQGVLNAAAAGMGMALAHFINPECLNWAPLYHKHFEPSPQWAQPRICLATHALAAASQDEANYYARSAALWRQKIAQGEFVSFTPPDQIDAQDVSLEPNRQRLTGTADKVAEELRALVETSQADELMIVTICTKDARLKSYQLLGELLL